jgi:hypothetical protein
MVTKEDVISEIEKIPDEKMGELYLLVKLFARRKRGKLESDAPSAFMAPTWAEHPVDIPIEELDTGSSDYSGTEDDWSTLSLEGLAGAYDEREPEYSLSLLREPNPEYERR